MTKKNRSTSGELTILEMAHKYISDKWHSSCENDLSDYGEKIAI